MPPPSKSTYYIVTAKRRADLTKGAGFFFFFFLGGGGRIQKRICGLRSFGSCRIKGTDEVDSSVPLMRHDPNDMRSQIRFRILPKKCT